MPVAIRKPPSSSRTSTGRTYEEDSLLPQRSMFPRRSPVGTPPRDEATFGKRRSAASIHAPSFPGPGTSSSPGMICNPSQPQSSVPHTQSSLARRWQHIFPHVLTKHDMKWKAKALPVCLPLTVEHFPTTAELESLYDVFSYDFVVDPGEMKSFLVKPPPAKANMEEWRKVWALAVMRGMAAVRLAQGFQFVLRRPNKGGEIEERMAIRRTKSLMAEDDLPKCVGASDVLGSPDDPVFLSMTNEIHRISYTGEAIQVRRYVRRMPPPKPFRYQCLMWPKLGDSTCWLQVTSITSTSHSATGVHDSSSSQPQKTLLQPQVQTTSRLDEEETRILGIEKLTEQFTKLRWQPAEERSTHTPPPVRVLPTTLGPALSVRYVALVEQLDQIHAAGPLRKKMKSEREIVDMPLAAIAKAMR
ncbi:hypothetical protein C0991_007312 [Blastosporella zonata]|nr:hypothetical protein C0991_007312 [Blastosporella zonata]